MLVLTEITKC